MGFNVTFTRTLSAILFTVLHIVYGASYSLRCFIQFTVLHTVYGASYSLQCFIQFTVLHTVYDKHMNVISFMSRRKGRPSQRQFSLNLRAQTTVRLQFFTDPNRKKQAENIGKILISALTLRLLMSYIYGAPILDVSRPHTTTQHSR